MIALKDHLADRLKLSRKWTTDLIADIDESTWFDPPCKGFGHVAWQLGHLGASQIALIHIRCFGKKFTDHAPENYLKLFGRGSEPVGGAANYPAIRDIRAFFERIQQESLQLIGSVDDASLTMATTGDPHPMFQDRSGAMAMAATHETFHAGQIAMIRRLAGKKPLR
jgi:uncharacterized damage-inducible protein DinB